MDDPKRLTFIDPRSAPEYEGELDLRYRVLRAPLGMGRHEVGFAGEENALHLVALAGAEVVGCVLFDLASGRLRAMAVDPARQGAGLGRALVTELERELSARGVREVTLHARAHVAGFYASLGYVSFGEPFTEVGIPHVSMRKVLSAQVGLARL